MGWRSRRSPPASPSLASPPTEWRLWARISFCSSTWRGRRGSMRASCGTGARLAPWSDGRWPICPCTPYGRRWWLSCSRPCSATVDASPQALLRRQLQHLVERNRQIANANACGVVDRVGHRRGDAGRSDLADALDADRIDVRIVVADEAHVDIADIALLRNQIFRQVGIEIATGARSDRRVLVQRHRDAVDDAAGG